MLFDNAFLVRHVRSQFRLKWIIAFLACYVLAFGISALLHWFQYDKESGRLARIQEMSREDKLRNIIEQNRWRWNEYEGGRWRQLSEEERLRRAENELNKIQASLDSGKSRLAQLFVNSFFHSVVFMQAFIMFFVGSLITVISSAQERSRKTLDFVSLTAYSPFKRACGEIAGRSALFNASIILTVPLMLVCYILGGATSGMILQSYGWLICGAFCFNALALVISSLARNLILSALLTVALAGAVFLICGARQSDIPSVPMGLSPMWSWTDDFSHTLMRWHKDVRGIYYPYYSYYSNYYEPYRATFFLTYISPAYLGMLFYAGLGWWAFQTLKGIYSGISLADLFRKRIFFLIFLFSLGWSGSLWYFAFGRYWDGGIWAYRNDGWAVALVGAFFVWAFLFLVMCLTAKTRTNAYEEVWHLDSQRWDILHLLFSERTSTTLYLAFSAIYSMVLFLVLDGIACYAFKEPMFSFLRFEPVNFGRFIPLLLLFGLFYCQLNQIFVFLMGRIGLVVTLFVLAAIMIITTLIPVPLLSSAINPIVGIGSWTNAYEFRYFRDEWNHAASFVGPIIGLILLSLWHRAIYRKYARQALGEKEKIEANMIEFHTLNNNKCSATPMS